MYLASHDRDRALAIWRFQGPISPVEWARHLADMESLGTWVTDPRPAVLMEIVDFAPNARQRAELAERSGRPGYRPYLALVTRHTILRGALQAITWLQRKQPYETCIFADAEGAFRWLESRRERPLPQLRSMYAEAAEGVSAHR